MHLPSSASEVHLNKTVNPLYGRAAKRILPGCSISTPAKWGEKKKKLKIIPLQE